MARFLKQHSEELIVNDLEEYSRVVNTCYLSNAEEVENLELDRHYRRLLRYMETHESPGFITELYAPRNPDCITADDRVFYTRRNAVYLDTARQTISLLPAEVRPYFIAPLLAEASVHTNTSGVFKGFYKDRNGIGKSGEREATPFPAFWEKFRCRFLCFPGLTAGIPSIAVTPMNWLPSCRKWMWCTWILPITSIRTVPIISC